MFALQLAKNVPTNLKIGSFYNIFARFNDDKLLAFFETISFTIWKIRK